MRRLPSANSHTMNMNYSYLQMTKSEYVASKNLPAQTPAPRLEVDYPASTHISQEKLPFNNRSKRFIISKYQSPYMMEEPYEMKRTFMEAKRQLLPSQEELLKRPKLRSDQISPNMQRQNLRQTENIKIIEQYEARLSQLNGETLHLQNQLFSEKQRYQNILNDFELQVKNLEISLQSERKTSEQLKMLVQTKNEEIRSCNRELEITERRSQEIENRMMHQQSEFERLKDILSDREEEIESWKLQIVKLEKNHLAELESQRNHTDYNQRLEEQIHRLKISHREEINTIEELNRLQKSKNNELQEKNEQANQEIQILHRQLNDACLQSEKAINEYHRLSRECESLRQMLNEKEREADGLQERVHLQEIQQQQSLEELRHQYEYMKKSTLDRELKELSLRHSGERLTLEQQIRISSHRIQDLEGNINELLQDNQQLGDQLKFAKKDNDTLQQKNVQLESDFERCIQVMAQNKKDYEFDLQSLRQSLQNEINDLTLHLNKTKGALVESETRGMKLDEEIAKLKEHLGQLQAEGSLFVENANKTERELRFQLETETETLKRYNEEQKQNYQVEINKRDATIEQLTSSNNHFTIELDSVRQSLMRCQNELENFKQKYNNLDQLRLSEINDYAEEFEGHRSKLKDELFKSNNEKSLLESQIKTLKAKVAEKETQIIQLEFSIEQLRQDLDEVGRVKENTIQKLTQDKNSLESQNKISKERLAIKDTEIEELQLKLTQAEEDLINSQQKSEDERVQLAQQNLKLEQTNRQLRQQINSQDLNIQSCKQQLIHQEETIEQQRQDNRILKEQQHNLTAQLHDEIHSLKTVITQHQQQLSEKQSKSQNQNEEIKKLQAKIKSLEEDNQDLKDKMQTLENDLNQEIDELQLQIEYCEKLQMDAKDWEIKSNAEKSALEQQLGTFKTKFEDENRRADRAIQEYHRLEDMLNERLKEIDQLRHLVGQSKISEEDYEKLKSKVNQQQNEIYDLQQDKLHINNEKTTLEKMVQRLQNEVQQKDQQVEQAYDLMNKRRTEQDSQGRDLDQLKRENQKLQATIQEQEATLRGKNDQIAQVRRENDELSNQNSSLKRQVTNMEDQVTQRQKEMNEKIRELDNLKSKYEDQWKQVQGGGNITGTSSRLSMIRQSIMPKEALIIPGEPQTSPERRSSRIRDNPARQQ